MADKLKILKADLEELDSLVVYWRGRREEKYIEICKEVGACPHCGNWHWPHCNTGD